MTVVAVLACCGLYALAARRLRRRGDRWPRRREAAAVLAGAALIGAALIGAVLIGGAMPIAMPMNTGPTGVERTGAEQTGTEQIGAAAVPWGSQLPPFTAHMAAHVAAGMVAPLLFALARPVTLTLRALPVGARRRLMAVTRSWPLTVLLFPPVAAAVDIGGLWLLYRAPLPPGIHHTPLLHVHLFAAGTLFTFSVLALDPLRHRAALPLRTAALLGAATAHTVLAKQLYAEGPPGTAYTTTDLHLAGRVMYYAGDMVEIALALVVAHQWYRARERRRGKDQRRRGRAKGDAAGTNGDAERTAPIRSDTVPGSRAGTYTGPPHQAG
ncbi:cytochrome c oxidase assembly protein [Streptomyces sp. NPDC059009]|uniref:cytochrome c oxidase assembly protein n=1 Tax=Streptomyces sp. NPDC059009 TaxID=3346694 RepID=UPI0036BEF285